MEKSLSGLPAISRNRALLLLFTTLPSYFLTVWAITAFGADAGSALPLFLRVEPLVAGVLGGTLALAIGPIRRLGFRVAFGHTLTAIALNLIVAAVVLLAVRLVYHVLTRERAATGQVIHMGALVVLLLACAIIVAAHRKIHIKTVTWGRYITLQKHLLDSSPWYPASNRADDPRETATTQIQSILENLSRSLDVPSANLVYHLYRRRTRSPRLISLWFPNGAQFRCRFRYPAADGVHARLVRDYQPVMHNAEEYEKFCLKWTDARPIQAHKIEEYEKERAKVTSAFGALWEQLETRTGGNDAEPIIDIPDLERWPRDDPYLDRGFLRFMNGGTPVRSLYLRLLKVGSKRLGVLAILDPLPHGLGIRDEDHLEAYCHLLQLVLARHEHFSRVRQPV
jgi:hypothetical protein